MISMISYGSSQVLGDVPRQGEVKAKEIPRASKKSKKILVQKSTPQNPILNFRGVKVFNKGLKLVIYPNI